MQENEDKSSMAPVLMLTLVVIFAIAGITYVFKSGDQLTTKTDINSTEKESTTSVTKPENPVDTSMLDTQKESTNSEEPENMPLVVNVEAGAFYYKPNELVVKKGQKIQITLTSVDMMHDFNIDELGVKAPIVKSGNTGTVEFVADKVGTFEYYCSVGQHRANGQVGTIIVEE